VASRRFSSALSAISATSDQHLAAGQRFAEVGHSKFCTEIEAYGQIEPVPSTTVRPGQNYVSIAKSRTSFRSPSTRFRNEIARQLRLARFRSAAASPAKRCREDHQVSQARLRDLFSRLPNVSADEIETGQVPIAFDDWTDMHGKSTANPPSISESKR